jgi:hypothetical protein
VNGAVNAPALAATGVLPEAGAWCAAAAHHAELFAPLVAGARIALLARSAPAHMLLWVAGASGTEAVACDFSSYAASGADIVLAADDEALDGIRAAPAQRLFEVLRAGIRSGHVVCYMLRRRCVLEERGYDELLEALGFAFMGACR